MEQDEMKSAIVDWIAKTNAIWLARGSYGNQRNVDHLETVGDLLSEYTGWRQTLTYRDVLAEFGPPVDDAFLAWIDGLPLPPAMAQTIGQITETLEGAGVDMESLATAHAALLTREYLASGNLATAEDSLLPALIGAGAPEAVWIDDELRGIAATWLDFFGGFFLASVGVTD